MFKKNINYLQIICHFFGGIYTCWFIIYGWHYAVFFQIMTICNVVPALVEIANVIAILCFKSEEY